jgi:molybdopterin-guanine dinucleotide biosynthesis protein A
MPLVDSRIFEFLLRMDAGYHAVIPAHGNSLEPLCGVYNKSAVPLLEACIAANQFSLQHFIRSSGCRLVEIGPGLNFYRDNLFTNINTIDDFGLLLKM